MHARKSSSSINNVHCSNVNVFCLKKIVVVNVRMVAMCMVLRSSSNNDARGSNMHAEEKGAEVLVMSIVATCMLKRSRSISNNVHGSNMHVDN